MPPPNPPPKELVTEPTAFLAEDITDVNGLSDKDIKRLRLDYLLLKKCAIIIYIGDPYNYDVNNATT
jgi:hypothetical protein